MPASDEQQDLKALEACWERLCTAVHQASREEFQQLVERWGERRHLDPICLSTDLLSPLGKEFHEPTHTQMLSSILDPSGGHELGTAPLRKLLDYVESILLGQEPQAVRVIQRMKKQLATARVQAERAVRLSRQDVAPKERLRTDLWIELPDSSPDLLLVIENKVFAPGHAGQLELYERAIQEQLNHWQRQGMKPYVIRLYLTVDAISAPETDQRWYPACYRELAFHLVSVLSGERTAGRELLRLYLATILQKLYGLRWREPASTMLRAELTHYLRETLKEA